jgi:hypothetical protein
VVAPALDRETAVLTLAKLYANENDQHTKQWLLAAARTGKLRSDAVLSNKAFKPMLQDDRFILPDIFGSAVAEDMKGLMFRRD